VSNDGHVPNVLRVVHETTDLVAQSVSISLMLPRISTGDAGVCVRVTYLLYREAVLLLAVVQPLLPMKRCKCSNLGGDAKRWRR